MISDELIVNTIDVMKNFSTGSGGAIQSPFTSTGTTGPTIPSINTMTCAKRVIDPASSHLPHKCPVPSYYDNRGRHKN